MAARGARTPHGSQQAVFCGDRWTLSVLHEDTGPQPVCFPVSLSVDSDEE